jgi:hypothetical protein
MRVQELLYPFRIESFVSVGAACSRDGILNRVYKPLPQIWQLHKGSLECNFST